MEVITFFKDLVWNYDKPTYIQFQLIQGVKVAKHRKKMTQLLLLAI